MAGLFRKVFRWNPKPAREAMLAAAREAARETAHYMAARAVDYAPVDTGFLSFNIQVHDVSRDGNPRFQVIASAPYSGYVEFGHLTPGGTWVPPNPFMRRALADGAKEFPQIAKKNRIGYAWSGEPESGIGTVFTT